MVGQRFQHRRDSGFIDGARHDARASSCSTCWGRPCPPGAPRGRSHERDGELAQITKDDTFVQTLVDEGRITAEEAHSHPQRSLIMRALTGHEVEPTLIMREARAGDRYLLCSDGLSDPVSHETIQEAMQIPDVAESADRLIELALRGGGPDNVTVVVADVVDYDYGQTQPILAGAVSGDDDQPPPDTAAGRASAFNPRRTEAKRVVRATRRDPETAALAA